jgi:nitrite reductase/ring-hydroxylating ferredoxin subunit
MADAGEITPSAPETAPSAWYRDPALWPLEQKNVFARSWLFACHVSAVAASNSWRAERLAGYPIVLVRDGAGVLRGFHNVCRHRAGPLTDGESGACEGELVCRYHGWRYALDGRLKRAREFGPARDFDPREFSLFPLRVETWRGLVFVALGEEAGAFADWAAPLDARLGDADWSGLDIALTRKHALACNWKTYVENYLEGYHVPLVHPGLDAEIDAAQYRVTMEGRVAIHEAPTRDANAVYDGLWAWLWPNLGFNVYARGLMLERMAPVGHRETRLEYLYLMPEGEGVAAATLAMSDAVTAEDKWIVERVQANLDAGVYETGRLSPRHEGAVAAFQEMVRHAITG